ncbi:hypothetical protein HDC36_003374 [Xanthomonas sp. JAI131]|uniref:hypothetical protein n=1 Tax=Xanthomonas sp. JAI131 TaxID=2723067 RepID=UPI0015C8052C|nr:hypothetical protein [Xanthomonas sp. JAI131]NYF21898.1 hypothetical protein [Xanthomonas sp. JAI131]
MTLPDDFEWELNRWAQDWLKCAGKIVAGVSQTAIRGIWIANVNRHDENTISYPHAYFRSRGAAMRSVERWACAHAARLPNEIATSARERAPLVPNRDEKRMARSMWG